MRKASTAFAAALLGTGAVVAVAAALPASAADCGSPTVTEQGHDGWVFQDVTWDDTGLNSTVGGPADESYGDHTTSTLLVGHTDQSGYTVSTDGAKPGFAYFLGIKSATDPATELFYEGGAWHTEVPGDQAGYSFSGTLADYATQHPDTQITDFGFNYGSGVPAGTVHVKSMSFNGCSYTFHAEQTPPTTTPPTTTPPTQTPPTQTPPTTTSPSTTSPSTGTPAPKPAGNGQVQVIPVTTSGIDTGGL